jgi:hypothetical protein
MAYLPQYLCFVTELCEIAHFPYDTHNSSERLYTDLLFTFSRALRSLLLKPYPKCPAKSSSEAASAYTVNVPRECRKLRYRRS